MYYLDYAAATPVSKKALDAMLPFFSDNFYNPSAAYLPAKHIRALYEEAKSQIAHTYGAKGTDLIITSGATEATNLAFTCIGARQKVLVLETEHSSVLEVAKTHNYDIIRVRERSGLIDLDDLRSKLEDDVVLISISLVNNELGTIQPFADIAEIIRKTRSVRLSNGISTPLFLHSDASQAMNLLDISVSRLGVDLMTINSAKIYGPKGIGALYVSHDVRLTPVIFGGGQEMGLRSGTENVPGVMGFAAAVTEAKQHVNGNRKKYEKLSHIFHTELDRLGDHAPLYLGSAKHQLSSFLPISFPGLDAERLIYRLEDRGVYVSTGAACAANKGSKSHVLQAIGLSDEEITGSLRISMGNGCTEDSVREAAQIIREEVSAEYARIERSK